MCVFDECIFNTTIDIPDVGPLNLCVFNTQACAYISCKMLTGDFDDN